MSTSICIMGNSGAGKTTSLRNLPPSETIIIDADGKGLAWRGWKKDFNTENKNYFKTDEPLKIISWLKTINTERPNIHYVVIDTINGIMWGEDNRKRKEKGYDKFLDLAGNIFDILLLANNMRDDLYIILTAHSQDDYTENGYMQTHIKTNGQKLSKIVPESKINCVLHAKVVDNKYVFEVHANNSTAKTPLGMFEQSTIPNDVMLVIKEYNEF